MARRVTAQPEAAGHPAGRRAVTDWFASRGWEAFGFQRETWSAYERGESGLVHAPTGMGKTLAVWLGPVMEGVEEIGKAGQWNRGTSQGRGGSQAAAAVRVLWVTPLRALAHDTGKSLAEPVADLAQTHGLRWDVQVRTGDTSSSLKAKQRRRLPTALVTTPESLSLLLSYRDTVEQLRGLRCVVVDEWHELMGSKRGVQTELCLARLRGLSPGLRTWGLSATLGNLAEAMAVLVGVGERGKVDNRERDHVKNRASERVEKRRLSESVAGGSSGGGSGGSSGGCFGGCSGGCSGGGGRLIEGEAAKEVRVQTLMPATLERFPWSGHLGTKLVEEVASSVEAVGTSLVFTNTRSQAELWFQALLDARPDWLGEIGLHHGSIDRGVREQVEDRLRAGTIRCVVCTSSLDLGVDFSPVDRVFQVGSPKGIARLMQRAGRSGHAPGRPSVVHGVPAHAFEFVEFAAARDAVLRRQVESRRPLRLCLDVLVQHMVTLAAGEGWEAEALYDEVRTTHAYAALSREQWDWCLRFVRHGGDTLKAYERYAKVVPSGKEREQGEESGRAEDRKSDSEATHAPTVTDAGNTKRGDAPRPSPLRYVVNGERVAREHRLSIGTITSDAGVQVRFANGHRLGVIEESFITRLRVGDRFTFSGRVLELVRVRQMTATVRPARQKRGTVPRWAGGRSPLSTQLAAGVRAKLDEALAGTCFDAARDPEMVRVRPLLELQRQWSVLPGSDQLLIEEHASRDGHHVFLFPFAGRLVHEGMGAFLAYRITRGRPASVTATCNDYGIELLTADPLGLSENDWRGVLTTDRLVDDLLACLNASELARRRFRGIARVAGLIQQGYPGQAKSSRQMQASSELIFDVFSAYDAENALLRQARDEVLEQELELARMRAALERVAGQSIVITRPPALTPMSFAIWADRIRATTLSSERWLDRVRKMSVVLEGRAG